MSERVISMVAESAKDFETRDSFLLCALMAVGIRPCSTERVRVITPEHAKRFLKALADNVEKFEAQHGAIKDQAGQNHFPLNFTPTAQA